MYLLTLLEGAKQEWLEAATYYELQRKGLGERFSEAVQLSLRSIQETPKHFQKTKKDYREALISPFPFLIVFRLHKTKNRVVVISIFHTKRKPSAKYRNK